MLKFKHMEVLRHLRQENDAVITSKNENIKKVKTLAGDLHTMFDETLKKVDGIA